MLHDIETMSKPEAFLVLRDVAKGLAVLFKKFKKFTPRSKLIGINKEGRAKIWLNENFAVFEPETEIIPV